MSLIGKKLSGRYELLDRVGGGGMAVVYKAKDILLDRIVAVKILRPQYAIDDDFVHRFRREAQAAASLSHPRIVSIYDVGVEEDVHYIVMEYVEGTTLKEYINKYAPLAVGEAVDIAKQIAEALDHAHQNQIIHRDIKPHNILIGSNRRIKVTDFGIARAVTSATITHTGSVIGSVHYFSPEQARGGMTGEKSDIYSLGIVLYEMLTGTLPFSGDSPISVALKHLQEAFVEPRQLNSSIPQSVENVIIRSLAKDILQRYTSARELIQDLETCLEPHRKSEEKYVVDHIDNDEATKEMPVIREDMLDTKVNIPTPSFTSDTKAEEEWEEEEEVRTKGSLWLKVGFSVLILFLLGFGVFQGVQFVNELFYVPEVEVADVTDLPAEEAEKILTEQGLRVDASRKRNSEEVEEGHIIRQDPIAGAPVKENTYVRLTVSMGKEKVEMPRLVGLPEETAKRLLSEFGEPQIQREYHADVQEGHIISQEPKAEQPVIPENTQVKLVISQGKEKFTMPDLKGKNEEEAKSILETLNLPLENIETGLSDQPEGNVYRQYPVEAGQEVAAGTPITIWVSEGYKNNEREVIEEVTVTLNDGESAQISVFVSDVNGDREEYNGTIQETTTFSIPVKVSRDQPAEIKIFKNGFIYDKREVTFE